MARHLEAHEHAGVVILDDRDLDRPNPRLVLEQCRLHLLLEQMGRRGQCLVDVGQIRQAVVGQMFQRPRARVQDAPHVLLHTQTFERPVLVRVERLAANLRRIGLSRVLFATDWPFVTASDYLRTLREGLKLTPVEIDQIFGNVAPYFR